MDLSIIIPTFNEISNIQPLVDRIIKTLSPRTIQYDIWFIDDSTDASPALLRSLSEKDKRVRFIHREHERGLGSAVVAGFHHSQGEHLIVMDADLQHPPELLGEILNQLQAGYELVLPTRFIVGGSDGGLNWKRKLISWTARQLGRAFLPRLRDVSDCTSGFFGLKRQVIANVSFKPDSWKILMEILVKGHYQNKKEIAYEFVARDSGVSKMRLREQWNYLCHIYALWNR